MKKGSEIFWQLDTNTRIQNVERFDQRLNRIRAKATYSKQICKSYSPPPVELSHFNSPSPYCTTVHIKAWCDLTIPENLCFKLIHHQCHRALDTCFVLVHAPQCAFYCALANFPVPQINLKKSLKMALFNLLNGFNFKRSQ